MKVIKRDGRAVEYNSDKICIAIEKANKEIVEEKRATNDEINQIINYIESLDKKRILVEDIQDIIEQKLMEFGKYELAKKYIVYRYTRALVRKQNTTDESILGLIKNVENGFEDGDKNNAIAAIQRSLIAGEVSKDLTKRILLPEKITRAHEEGVLHFHGMEYFLQPIINSCVINIGDMLANGTSINNQKIETPKSFLESCAVTAQIINTIGNSQYGRIYINIKHLGKYLRKSYEALKSNLELLDTESVNQDIVEKFIQERLRSEISEGIYIIKLHINSLINIYEKYPVVVLNLVNDTSEEFFKEIELIINEILKQKLENVQLIEDAADAEIFQHEGHFNYGIVTINLPQIAGLIDEDEKEFWNILDDRLELCYEALMCRHYALLGTNSDTSPIHWQSGAIARLQQGERIDKLLKDGYSDISLGYVGVKETTEIMSSILSFDNDYKEKFFNKLIKYMEDRVQSWRKMTGIGFTLYENIDDSASKRLNAINKRKLGK